jgi:hypothetical protein
MRVADLVPGLDAPYDGDDARLRAWTLGGFAALYAATPFLQIFAASGRARFPYPQLFEHSWNNFLVGAVAVLFTGALWALLGVWAALFQIVGIALFADLFGSNGFAYLATFAAFGAGLALGRASEGPIATLRRVTLLMTQILLPLVCFVALLFVAVLPVTGLAPLWKTGSATGLVLTLLALLAISLNALHEDGRRAPPARWMCWLARAAVLAMPVYATIALRATTLRIGQYGLTPDRVYALVLVAITGVYACGYAVAALRRRADWMRGLEPANVAGAVFVVVVAIAVALPPLDPFRLSARDQFERFASGRVPAAKFDFAALRFELGRYGWKRLAEIEALTDHPEADAARKAIAAVRAAAGRWDIEERIPELSRDSFVLAAANVPTPRQLLDRMAADAPEQLHACGGRARCTLFSADLDSDGRDEVCVITSMNQTPWTYGRCYASDAASGWHAIGGLAQRGGRASAVEIQRRLESSATTLRSSLYREIDLGGGSALVVTPDP